MPVRNIALDLPGFNRFLDEFSARVDRFARILPDKITARLVPLIKKELDRVPVSTGRLRRSKFIRIRKQPGKVLIHFGWQAFYAAFVGASRKRLEMFIESRPFQKAIEAGIADAFREAGLRGSGTLRL